MSLSLTGLSSWFLHLPFYSKIAVYWRGCKNVRPGYFRNDIFLQYQILSTRIIENILKSVERTSALILWLKTLFSFRVDYILHPESQEGRFLREREGLLFGVSLLSTKNYIELFLKVLSLLRVSFTKNVISSCFSHLHLCCCSLDQKLEGKLY